MFNFTEEQLMVQTTAREFATKELAPIAKELDAEARFPEEKIRMLGELGLMGVMVPEEYGGAGMDLISYILAIEEIAKCCAGTSVVVMGNNSLACTPILNAGTEQQKRTFLPRLASGEIIGCFALTEPGAGSDVSAMRTKAVRQGDEWVLDGEKNFITNAPNSGLAIVFAVTSKGAEKKDITSFLVPMDAEGISLGPKENKLGVRASHSCSIFFDNVRIPADNMLGREGEGVHVALRTLDCGRIGIAAQACGIASAAFDEAVKYSKERKAFGGSLSQLQAIQFKIADMASRLEAARIYSYYAAGLKQAGKPCTKEAAIAKVTASEAANFIAYQAMQIHGGYGYTTEYAAERHFRDARITDIYEGTSEIQRVVIASNIFRAA